MSADTSARRGLSGRRTNSGLGRVLLEGVAVGVWACLPKSPCDPNRNSLQTGNGAMRTSPLAGIGHPFNAVSAHRQSVNERALCVAFNAYSLTLTERERSALLELSLRVATHSGGERCPMRVPRRPLSCVASDPQDPRRGRSRVPSLRSCARKSRPAPRTVAVRPVAWL